MYYNSLFLFCLAYLLFLIYNDVGDFMKLIEKKCSNCGASLKFGENNTSCKCEYCGTAFEIKRDDSVKTSSISDQFSLNKLEKPLKIFGLYVASTYIIGIIITVFVLIFISVFGYKVYESNNKSTKSFLDDKIDTVKKENTSTYLSSIDQIENDNYEDIDHDAEMKIISRGEGVNNVYHSYTRDGDPKREKIYVAAKENENKVIAIYRANYYDFFHQANRYTIYVPILYENIKKDYVRYEFKNPKVNAPEYYFNPEKTSYAYGYGSFDEAYNNVVKPLENDYKITQK